MAAPRPAQGPGAGAASGPDGPGRLRSPAVWMTGASRRQPA